MPFNHLDADVILETLSLTDVYTVVSISRVRPLSTVKDFRIKTLLDA